MAICARAAKLPPSCRWAACPEKGHFFQGPPEDQGLLCSDEGQRLSSKVAQLEAVH